jgi:hydroxymethylbilane synthase
MKTKWIVGTRGSKLALKQADMVINQLKHHYPEYEFLTKTIKTTGDAVWDKPLQSIGEKGLFVKEIEEELMAGKIDMAVHSMKDLPTDLAHGLAIGAILKREDPRDAFISFNLSKFSEVGSGSKIGTNSVRRKSQLLHLNKEIEVIPIRGNVDTRIEKIRVLNLDGIVLAVAGVRRMGLAHYVKDILPLDAMVPPSGQGAIGVEARGDDEALRLLLPVNDMASYREVSIERRFQSLVGGGCSVPLGVNASIIDSTLTLHVTYGDENGRNMKRAKETGNVVDTDSLIMAAFDKLSSQ